MSLFANGHSTDEVRKAIGQHFQRDAKTIGVLDLLTVGAVLVLTRHMEMLDRIAMWVAVLSILKACGCSWIRSSATGISIGSTGTMRSSGSAQATVDSRRVPGGLETVMTLVGAPGGPV